MTSVFKQAATQSRTSVLTQLPHTINSPASNLYRPESEPKCGKSKFVSRHSSKIMTSFEKDTALTISLDQHYPQP